MERHNRTTARTQLERLEELEERTRALDGAIDYADKLAYEARHREERDARLALGRGDAELDEAVDESFPASDASSTARSREDGELQSLREMSSELDDALDDTFPASDPPSILSPRPDDEA
ncbi:MAG TPA: hypothetical protein VFF10_03770 [Trueperaceae bacterium]|nr:hypothetical protein [Trueperaceae bacterium]